MRMPFSLVGLAVVSTTALAADRDGIRDLAVTPAQIERMAIRTQAVKPTDEQVLAVLPGIVVPALNARIVAAAPFAGTVTQVLVLPGQRIEKGDALARISSRELLETSAALAQARAEVQVAEAIARRRRDLADKNIQSPTMAEEAEAQVSKIEAVIEQHKLALAIGGIVTTDPGSYTIIASDAGRIVETKVMPGDKVEAMDPAVTIDTSDELWIEAQLPGHLVSSVALGDRIRITGGPEGQVVSVAGSLDRMTRSLKLTARVPPNSGLLPGQMITLSLIQKAATGALSVPASAVANIESSEGLFVRSENGFKLVPVEVTGRSPEQATVRGDIATDAQVAASGLPQLEQMLGAE